MITPEEFPYIKSLYVNDCYAYKDFNIELHDDKPFSHLILTGKNGSGKSTILRILDKHFKEWRGGENPIVTVERAHRVLKRKPVSDSDEEYYKDVLEEYGRINPKFATDPVNFWGSVNRITKSTIVYSFLKASRVSKVAEVKTVTTEREFTDVFLESNSTEYFVKKFKQYLVNKKVYQAFDQLGNDTSKLAESTKFFSDVTDTFRTIFEDSGLELVFVHEMFEFYIGLSDGRYLTFEILSEGFSALLSILMDLFMRVDLIRKQVGNYSYNPCGIVLIDEPETHLHLQLQEQVLPLLTSLFPNVQFIVATHSPAVIASIKNATIFDLTTRESRGSEETVGRSYSELMRAHFGLNNEYSGIADELFRKVDQIIKEHKNQPEELKMKLQQFFVENEAYLSPTFRVELESMILENV